MKARFAVTFSFAAAALAAASMLACGLEHGSPLYGTDGGGGSSGDPTPDPTPEPTPEPYPTVQPQPNMPVPEPESCPPQEPSAKSFCYLAEGTTCSYVDGCESRPSDVFSEKTFGCFGGYWTLTSKPYVAPCPAAQPSQGQSCGLCATELPAECTYGDPSSGCVTYAQCDPTTGTWQVKPSACIPPPADAGAGP